ncbi:unnamed protein product [Rotaria magnacalcarata]|uniref:Uncharacterized protein n=1 Tax=Rotaria magnacalcarata TaxID=392030 RepID=A0A816ZQS1_9BILA|nr:unnamed protein product [Rotaria magnacalcarata]CAF3790198.1 unnamed protein product [Rotaria magnacalcarata]
MSSSGDSANADQTVTIRAGAMGKNPHSTLNPKVAHAKADLNNHANQLNPNNPRYAGHQERLAAVAASHEAAILHEQAKAAYQYAAQIEAAAIKAQTVAIELHREAALCAQHASTGLNASRERGRGHGRVSHAVVGQDSQENKCNQEHHEDGEHENHGYDAENYEDEHDHQQNAADNNQQLPQQ